MKKIQNGSQFMAHFYNEAADGVGMIFCPDSVFFKKKFFCVGSIDFLWGFYVIIALWCLLCACPMALLSLIMILETDAGRGCEVHRHWVWCQSRCRGREGVPGSRDRPSGSWHRALDSRSMNSVDTPSGKKSFFAFFLISFLFFFFSKEDSYLFIFLLVSFLSEFSCRWNGRTDHLSGRQLSLLNSSPKMITPF